jgi:RNA polymerase sigma-70 factor (ECF subfamily)
VTRRAANESSVPATSIHVRRAIEGDLESLTWIIERFSPVLLSQARFRLGPALRRFCDPEDLVADVWGVALRRLGDLRLAADSSTGTLIRYLGTVLLRRVRDIAHLAVVRRSSPAAPGDAQRESVSQIDAATTSVVSRAIRGERAELILSAIDALDPLDRQVIVLRGFEGASLDEAAAIMEATPGAVSTRYHRALKRLREKLPDTVLAELTED